MTRRIIIGESLIYSIPLVMVGVMAYYEYTAIRGGAETIFVVVYGVATLGLFIGWGMMFFLYSKIGERIGKAIRQRLGR